MGVRCQSVRRRRQGAEVTSCSARRAGLECEYVEAEVGRWCRHCGERPPIEGNQDPRAMARGSDPATSHGAARRAALRSGTVRSQIVNTVATAGPVGLTGEEIAERLGRAWNRISSSLTELGRQGWLRKDGTRPTSTGSEAAVWVLAPPPSQAVQSAADQGTRSEGEQDAMV